MRRIVMVLILTVCGCSDGGVGVAGFGAPALDPGIYSGQSSCTASGPGTESTVSSRIDTYIISEDGLPILAGGEVAEGQLRARDLFGLSLVVVIQSVVESINGVQILGEGILEVADPNETRIVYVYENLTFQRSGLGTITVIDEFLLTEVTSRGIEFLIINCFGQASRSAD